MLRNMRKMSLIMMMAYLIFGLACCMYVNAAEDENSDENMETIETSEEDKIEDTSSPVSYITLSHDRIDLEVGEEIQLEAIAYDNNHLEQDVIFEWTSSSPDIITVDESGVITALQSGQATISAKSGEISASCEVKAVFSISSIVLNMKEYELEENETVQLTVNILPQNTTEDYILLWNSSDEDVVSVSENGVITAKSAGEAIIEVSTDKEVSDACHVKVIPKVVKTGWQIENGEWYYYKSSGEPFVGWLLHGGKWYCMNSEGKMQTGLTQVGTKYYYLDTSGAMKIGWIKTGGYWYYFKSGGEAHTGWINLGGKWYYMNSEGKMQTGLTKVGTRYYYLDASGVMKTGWIKTGGYWYYFKSGGEAHTGWINLGGKWYYMNSEGKMQTGLTKVGTKYYYLDASGAMKTGWIKTGGYWYYFKSGGEAHTGWINLGGKWYYLNSEGRMQMGLTKVGSKYYYLDSGGVMKTGWIKTGGYWYYFKSAGDAQIGWLKLGNIWYYFKPDATMVNHDMVIGGKLNRFDSSGVWKGVDESGNISFMRDNIMHIDQCIASKDGSAMTINIIASRSQQMEAMGKVFYIVLLDSRGTRLVKGIEGKEEKGNSFKISASFSTSDLFRAECMGKYAIAVREGQIYQVISDTSFLMNPQIFASTTKGYQGFYEGKLSSKKGMQGTHKNATADLDIQAPLLNIKLNELVKSSANVAKYGSSAYDPYTYKGKTYYFHNMINYMQTVKDLNGWSGEDGQYGGTHRQVSLNLLLGWDSELQYLIHPSARVSGHTCYALNMEEQGARDTYEALFCYMAEKLGGSVLLSTEKSVYKYRVCNWILGNEVNACRAWNYSGDLSLQDCVENYAEAFQLLYQGVKRTDSEARVFISLDHDWNAGQNGHSGKAFLDQFASCMYKEAPHMRWNVDYHPYSQPLTRNDFWNDNSNTISSSGTGFISMKNLNVLTDYLGILEKKYFPDKGSGYIRVILGEQGFIASDKSQEASQAAAIGYGFYIASMNGRVDSYIIRAYNDDPSEGVMTLGVMYRGDAKKEAYAVYKKLGTADSMTCLNSYLYLVSSAAKSWTEIVPGLTLDALYRP